MRRGLPRSRAVRASALCTDEPLAQSDPGETILFLCIVGLFSIGALFHRLLGFQGWGVGSRSRDGREDVGMVVMLIRRVEGGAGQGVVEASRVG
jgi:hypothetical protein